MVMWPNGRIAGPKRDRSHRIVPPEVDVIEAEPQLGEPLDAAVLARLQLGPRPKPLDLHTARLVKVALFEYLAGAWQAPRGTVDRLGVLLDYERWIILRSVAARRLQPIIDRGDYSARLDSRNSGRAQLQMTGSRTASYPGSNGR
jgi:hypothetical protein